MIRKFIIKEVDWLLGGFRWYRQRRGERWLYIDPTPVGVSPYWTKDDGKKQSYVRASENHGPEVILEVRA